MLYTVENIIEDVIVTCFESGYSNWFGVDFSTQEWTEHPEGIPTSMWAAKLINDGRSIILLGPEGESSRWILTKEKIMSGYQQNAKERPDDCVLDEGDAFTRDSILQYALFNELRYIV